MIMRTLRLLLALSLLAMGAVHLQQYLGAGYSSIPTIGVLFLLNAIGAAMLGFGLLAPIGALTRDRAAQLATGLLAAAGSAMALASLVALLLSEEGTLFDFHEAGSGGPITAAIASEIVAVVTGAALTAMSFRRGARGGRAERAATWGSRSSIGRT